MKILRKAADMKAIDKASMSEPYGIAPAVLMENAGRAVCEKGGVYVGGWSGKDVMILCGKGNNGGDGFVTARHILAEGGRVYVYAFGEKDGYSDESKAHLKTLEAMCDGERCSLIYYRTASDSALLIKQLDTCHVVIDALLGTGFKGELREPYKSIVTAVNEATAGRHVTVISVDMPSGVNSDTGAVSGSESEEESAPVMADLTVTFGAFKQGQFLYPGKACTGKLEIDHIGIPVALSEQCKEAVFLPERQDVIDAVRPRRVDSHKGTHGTVAVLTGCNDMAGAALMTVDGAVRAGAGKVFLYTPSETAKYCIARQPEVMVHGVGPAGTRTLGGSEAREIIDNLENVSVLVMGPGMGKHEGVFDFINYIAEKTTCPMIIDADGLNCLAKHDKQAFFKKYGKRTVITPHPAEFSRLSGLSVRDIKTDLIKAATDFVHTYGVNLVLKGAPTLTVSAKTGHVYVNRTGNAGMATGGMGDVLSGITAAMICHDGIDSLAVAACAAVYLHGAAGDYCARHIGPYGFTATEVASAVPKVLAQWDEARPMPALQEPYIMS